MVISKFVIWRFVKSRFHCNRIKRAHQKCPFLNQIYAQLQGMYPAITGSNIPKEETERP